MNKIVKWVPVAGLLAVLVLAALFLPRDPPGGVPVQIPYSQFKSLVAKGLVADVTFNGKRASGRLAKAQPLGPNARPAERFKTDLPAFGDPALLPLLEERGVEYSASGAGETDMGGALIGILPWLLFIGIYIWFWRRISRNMPGGMGGSGDIDKFLSGSATREEESAGPRITFADVAGQENAKREVQELVEFLRTPDRYTRLGAEVPHGVLLMGPPGTGKTLLAKALAGEAEVPFFSISASEFIEVFVGVGASRVRRMFDEAKKRAPSIIFIDELDSVGRVRGTGLGGGHDEREQTLNQILAELDGFSGREAVVVLAATNRPDVLDPALLRPGRFDRHVTLDLPDVDARRQILDVHCRRVPLAGDVNLDRIAAGTPGFSGADLKNLVNEAAMRAAREGRDAVTADDFDEMRDRVMMGTVRTLAIQPEERHRLAVHEAGHAIAAYFLPHADPLYKVSIIPRGRALGVTQQVPEAERHTLPEAYLRDRLTVMLSGRAAEKTLLDSISSGADDDIRQATALARAMVSRWGMSDKVGPVDVRESDEHPFLGREIAQPRRFSEATAKIVDEAVRELLAQSEASAEKQIADHRAEMSRLIAALEDREALGREELQACLGPLPDKGGNKPGPDPRRAKAG